MTDLRSPSIKPLGRDNYFTWSFAIRSVLNRENLWKFVEKRPDEFPPGQREIAEEKSQRALSTIILYVDEQHYLMLMKHTNATDAWEAIKQKFSSGLKPRIRQLKSQLTTLEKQQGTRMSDYINAGIELQKQLELVGVSVADSELVDSLLEGLQKFPEYNSTVDGIDRDNATLSEVQERLVVAESRAIAQSGVANEGQAFAVKGKQWTPKPGGDGKHGKGYHKDKKCFYCHQWGHIAPHCKRKQADEQGAKGKARQSHEAGGSYRAYSVSAMSGINGDVNGISKRSVIIDTGATRHLTPMREYLHNVRELPKPVLITYGGGSSEMCDLEGDLKMKGEDGHVLIRNVVYAPGAEMGMLSGGILLEKGLKIVVSGKHMHLLEDEVVVLSATCKGRLFLLDTSKFITTAFACTARDAIASANLWHRRFGHLGHENLKKVSSMVHGMDRACLGGFGAIDACETCAMSKQHRLPFNASMHRTDKPLALVHMDLCGPMRVESREGALYVATFTDDCTRFVAIELLRTKGELLGAMKKVFKLWETQLGRSVKAVRSDRGGSTWVEKFRPIFRKEGWSIKPPILTLHNRMGWLRG